MMMLRLKKHVVKGITKRQAVGSHPCWHKFSSRRRHLLIELSEIHGKSMSSWLTAATLFTKDALTGTLSFFSTSCHEVSLLPLVAFLYNYIIVFLVGPRPVLFVSWWLIELLTIFQFQFHRTDWNKLLSWVPQERVPPCPRTPSLISG